MPNICSYYCKVTGPKKGIDRFINATNNNYNYSTYEVAGEHFWRVFETYISVLEQCPNNPELYTLIASGDCAWSIACCFTEVPFSYQHDNKMTMPNNKGVSVEQLSKEEQLIIEMYSDEIGMGFSEHYIWINGKLYTESVVDYTECDPEMDLEELNERSGNNWTQEQWDKYFKTEDYYICCEHDFKYADHIKLYKEYYNGN